MSSALLLYKEGDTYEHSVLVTADTMHKFLEVSGDANPIHLDPAYAARHGFKANVVYGNFLGAMVSHVVGMKLPSKEVLLLRQSLDFRMPTFVGEEIALRATVAGVSEAVGTVALKLSFKSSSGTEVCTGQCLVKLL